jgi:hypothetical protein
MLGCGWDEIGRGEGREGRHADASGAVSGSAGSQSYPSPAAEPDADGSTTVYIAPDQPDGAARGIWSRTVPGRGWFVNLRPYSPLEPIFDKSWRVGDIEALG